METKRLYQFLVMFMFLAGACLATFYFRHVMKDAILITHFFYIPIIMASLCWYKWGVIVAIILGGQLILNILLANNTDNQELLYDTDIYLRAVMFLVMAFVVGLLSERYTETREQVSDYEDELRALATELSLAEEREKHRIAVELHDHFGQELALFRIKLEDMKKSSTSSDFTQEIDRFSGRLRASIKGLRSLTFDLSSSTLFELGFKKAVNEWLRARMEEEHGISTEFTSEGEWESLDENIKVVLFQAVRELLVNVVKHAQATMVKVSIYKEPTEIMITVQDDGVGFDSSEIGVGSKASGKLGLFSIRERMGYFGGRLEIDSRLKRGSLLTLRLPLKFKEISKES